MISLYEAFRSTDSRTTRVIVIVRLIDGTKMKQQEPETFWLATYGWFFDLLAQTISAYQGGVVKYIEDGVMAVFGEDAATSAINWAIRVQEEIIRAQDNRRVLCDCSIGVASGSVVQFQTSTNYEDYIGEVVDRAYLLCAAANGKALFVDTDSVMSASMRQVQSQAGEVSPKRTPAEYLGSVQSVKGAGFQKPVEYHEILWARSRYGVSAPFVSDLSKRAERAGAPTEPVVARTSGVASSQERLPWQRGLVDTYDEARGFGFITGKPGESFYFRPEYLFDAAMDIQRGSMVWFLPKEPLPNAKNRRASDILLLGATIVGDLEKVFPQGFGFAACRNSLGEQRLIFVNLGDASAWQRGDRIRFIVGENKQGVAGNEPQKV